ncbi:hypothetical protein KP509_01G050100 [Ceratopteris richardii]|uniref:ABC transporter D family member 1 n=1 Tax=Ceratopteris richardii TaxID=49495 RepID=A0A8T2VKG9_CERRI|nr:hypothetical protein KP509_01G050100 [Ceratopteris richardii]
MTSSQLLKPFQQPSGKRKVLAVAAAVLVAGGGLAYANSSSNRQKTRQPSPCNGSGNATEKPIAGGNLAGSQKPKKGGMKSVNLLAGILITQMGTKGMRALLSLAAIAVLRTALSNRLAKVQGFLFRAAFLRRAPLFFRLIVENLLLCLAQSALFSTSKFITGLLSLQFRKILTDRVHADYFQNMTFYKISHVDRRISNPEQRIASDIPRFSSELSEVIQENMTACCDGLLYTWRLCSYASPKYALWILAYVLGAGFVTGTVSPPFGKLMSKEQQLEGDYRQIHTRLRTHSESIAFYAGQEREASFVKQRFQALVKHLSTVLHTQWWFGMIQDFTLKYLGATVGVVLIIEPFFSGNLKPDHSTLGRAEMLSNMRYHTSVIIALFQALGTFAFNSRKLHRISGYADRIRELMVVARELRFSSNSRGLSNKESSGYFVESNYIEFKGVKVVTPTGNTLVENLTLKVEPGSNLLITGPNGSGKSSLFRVLGGLWPLVSGCIAKPGVGSSLNNVIFYVPQRPYTAVGTLKDQLIYPLTSDTETEVLSEEGMRELLRNVDLEYLLDRYPLDMEVNWGDELSLGEQQRLGMARLFYHKPAFAILDECTSAVTTDMEERFCAKVRAMGTSCITISHRPALVAFHDIVLSLDGEGSSTIHYKGVGHSSSEDLAGLGIMSSRQNDALTVQKAFSTLKEDDPYHSSQSFDSYIKRIHARSPPPEASKSISVVPRLKGETQSMPIRVAALSTILVPSLYGKQGGQLMAVALLVIARTWISDRIAHLNGTSVKYVLEQDKAAFIRLTGISVLQSAASAVVAPSLRYLAALLALGWRRRLTDHLSNLYFSKNAFYKVFHLAETRIDADQRITQDVNKLGGDLSGLVTGMVKPLVDILWFTWRMRTLTGRRGVAILYAYMFLGLGFLHGITPNFGALTSKEQQLEGLFRFMHSRLHTHAESVAFFGGGLREQAMIEARFSALLEHSKKLLIRRWIFGIADEFITKQLPHNVTWGLSLMYAMDHAGDRASTSVQGELAHALRFLASVVSQSFLAFGDLMELYRKFLELSGGIARISELDELLHAAQKEAKSSHNAVSVGSSKRSDEIEFSEVDIVTPTQKLLARKLTFKVSPNKSLLVTGPNGSGKSSLFRVLGGLWPIASGIISKPSASVHDQYKTGLSREIFYVPQHPYTALGTLRDQIIYPLTLDEAIQKVSEAYKEGDRDQALELLDRRLLSTLEDVRLVYLLEREGGWNTCANWEDMLSLGEQQRLGMARLFFHQPKYGILDECTNATSVDVEEHLYKLAESMGITVVTISQRPALIPFHSMELKLVDGEGGWELCSIQSE